MICPLPRPLADNGQRQIVVWLVGRFVVTAGWVIPATLKTMMDSDLPGNGIGRNDRGVPDHRLLD